MNPDRRAPPCVEKSDAHSSRKRRLNHRESGGEGRQGVESSWRPSFTSGRGVQEHHADVLGVARVANQRDCCDMSGEATVFTGSGPPPRRRALLQLTLSAVGRMVM